MGTGGSGARVQIQVYFDRARDRRSKNRKQGGNDANETVKKERKKKRVAGGGGAEKGWAVGNKRRKGK